MTRSVGSRPGLTLVELIVVVGIISVILGLLLPGLEAAREASRRTQCINSMRELGTSMHTYHNLNERFPPGVVDRSGPIRNEPVGYHVGWIVQLLPHLEQGMLAMGMSEYAGVYDPSNSAMRMARIGILLCPSDLGPEQGKDGAFGTNYKGCHHDVEAPIDGDNQGVLFLNSRVRYDDIEDGLSETIMLGEALRNDSDLGWVSGTRGTLRNTGSPINLGNLWDLPAAQARWSDGTAILKPGPPPDPKRDTRVGGFGSRHPGGANFTFCDGSVRFLSETVERRTFQCLGHRSDGEMISLSNR